MGYEDWLGHKLHDAQQEEEAETSRASAWQDPLTFAIADPPLQSSLAVEGQGGAVSALDVAEAEQVSFI